jgi:N-acetylmuramoyl-L-alanine amidase
MKSLSRVREFFSRKDHALSLKLRVASALNVFVSIRGLDALLNSGTAVVMRQGYETLVIQDTSAIDNREKVLALVHVKDMECYDRLLTIKTNHCFHRGKLNRTISNDLADEMAKQLLKKAGKIDNGKRRMISKALEFYQS